MSKGHVPDENLAKYRYLRRHAHAAEDLGSVLSNMGEYGMANAAWAIETKIREKMLELRVDIPDGNN